MNFSKQKLSIEEARQIDITDYLSRLGYQPTKVRNYDYWYLSPLRIEKTPSFKVNKKLNVWFDFGEGKGGNLIDFAIQYFKCSVSEVLTRLSQKNIYNFSFHPPFADEKKMSQTGRFKS
jgi:DNA primase